MAAALIACGPSFTGVRAGAGFVRQEDDGGVGIGFKSVTDFLCYKEVKTKEVRTVYDLKGDSAC